MLIAIPKKSYAVSSGLTLRRNNLGKTHDEQDLQSTFKGSLGPGDLRLDQGADAHFPAEVVGHQHCRLQPQQHTNRPVLHAGHIWHIKLFNWIYLHPD